MLKYRSRSAASPRGPLERLWRLLAAEYRVVERWNDGNARFRVFLAVLLSGLEDVGR